jgi:hypothetical protein
MTENNWRALYQAAVFEVDREKVGASAMAAELAINAHVFSDHQHTSSAERADMQHALSTLDILRHEGQQSAMGELKKI